jgi:hypothetical protein
MPERVPHPNGVLDRRLVSRFDGSDRRSRRSCCHHHPLAPAVSHPHPPPPHPPTPHPPPPQGISNKMAICETCNMKLADCAGHFGYIKLELPVFHIGYFKNTLQVLQCICKTCSRLLLPDAEKRKWSR